MRADRTEVIGTPPAVPAVTGAAAAKSTTTEDAAKTKEEAAAATMARRARDAEEVRATRGCTEAPAGATGRCETSSMTSMSRRLPTGPEVESRNLDGIVRKIVRDWMDGGRRPAGSQYT
jgi:hypothetical protein